jgi:class 3 adenylate cyclase
LILRGSRQNKTLGLTAVAALVLLFSLGLYLGSDRFVLPLIGFPQAFLGTGLLATSLALLRPSLGIYKSFRARLLWGFSLAHFFILFMCAAALVGIVTDPRIAGPLTAFALFGLFYSLGIWTCVVIFKIYDPVGSTPPQEATASHKTFGIVLSPLIHLPVYHITLIGILDDGDLTPSLKGVLDHVVLIDTEPFLYSLLVWLFVCGLLVLIRKRKLVSYDSTRFMALFLLIHAMFTITKFIALLFEMSDYAEVERVQGEAVSGYAFVFVAYAVWLVITRRKPSNRLSKFVVVATTITLSGAFLVFSTVAPTEILIFALIPLILLASIMAYLSNLEGTIKERTDELAEEKEKTEGLLANILPQYVVEELKEKGTSTPKFFDEVAVMFTDFVGFTTITQKLPPKDLIKELNTIFTRFDEILEQHQSERIKTIGDAYMCVSGLSASNSTPASNLLRISREMLTALKEINEALGTDWQIRIGVASGNCIGGIVGTKKYQFDLFGDTVNTAARMEAYSSSGCVNIDAKTYEAVCNEPSFIFKARPLTAVKGKGDQQMFFVEHTNQTPDQ